ncbi:PseG/SpsG family protein [Microlunatus sp. Y2014]|uniref:PseG/SpsG family protein n=1 Tax=Microlunatus sp. Y2014 TaxID=3418488 RepID=UPI003DA6DD27
MAAPQSTPADEPVVIRTDCSPQMGVGHLLRSLALAEELQHRGHRVHLLGSTGGLDWADGQVAARGLTMTPAADLVGGPAALVDQVSRLGAAGIDLDGYHLSADLGAALRAAGVPVMTMVDDTFGLHQHADLYVDQNLDAVVADRLPVPGARMLAGLDHVVLRDQVLDRRGLVPDQALDHGGDRTPRLLVVFGGTDAYGGAEVVIGLLRELARPVRVVAVVSRSEVADRLAGLPPVPGVELELHPVVNDLPGLAVGCDAAVSAAGSSVWELLCLGIPTGVVCVVDNQLAGYRRTTDTGVAVAIGELDRLRDDPAAREEARGELAVLLGDRPRRRQLQQAGRRLVDGRGRRRVVDAFTGLFAGRS